MILTIEKPKKNQIYYSWISSNYNMNILDGESFMNEVLVGSGLSLFQIKYLKKEYGQIISMREVLENHSIAPIMKVFMNQSQYDSIVENIYKQSIEGAKSVQSLVTSMYRFKNNGLYKICPVCHKEDEESFGFAYLHREHQLDGVRCCHKHRVDLLFIHDKNLTNNRLMESNNIVFRYMKQSTLTENKLYLKLASMIYDILCESYLESFCLSDVQLRYRERLKELGYWFNGGIDQDRLQKDLIHYYGKNALEELDANPGVNAPLNWIKIITTKSQQPSKPIWHLLLINYLFNDLKMFKEYHVEKQKPFGEGPWPCLNKVCECYKEETIKEIKISRARHKNIPRGEWECAKCGYIYMRLGEDKKDIDKYRKDRVISYGPIWEEKFIYLCTKTNRGRKEIANEMGCGISIIDRQREELALNMRKHHPNKVEIDNIKVYKYELLQYISKNPDSNKSIIKRKFRNQVRIIKLYDREWYDKYIPKPKNIAFTCENKQKEFWEKRDKEVSNKIKKIVEEILSKNKEIWITKEMLGRVCNYMGLKYKENLDRMPSTQKELEKSCESKSEYIIRIKKK